MSKSFPTPSKTFFILFFLHLFLSLVLRLTGQLEQRIFNEILIYGALAYSMIGSQWNYDPSYLKTSSVLFLLYLLSIYTLQDFSNNGLSASEAIEWGTTLFAFFSSWGLLSNSIKQPLLRVCCRAIYYGGLWLTASVPLLGIGYGIVSGGHALSADLILAVFQTNPGEALSYLKEQPLFLWALSLLGIFAISILVISLSRKMLKAAPVQKPSIILILMALLALNMKSTLPRIKIFYLANTITSARTSLKAYEQYKIMKEIRLNRLSALPPLSIDSQARGTYVLVIGESASRDHMHVYGYDRQTTPWMDKMAGCKGTTIFSYPYANYCQTILSLTYALSEKNQYNHIPLEEAYSIIDLAKAAGYDTYWISNQAGFSASDTPITIISSTAAHHTWINGRGASPSDSTYLDGKLITELPDNVDRPSFIVIPGMQIVIPNHTVSFRGEENLLTAMTIRFAMSTASFKASLKKSIITPIFKDFFTCLTMEKIQNQEMPILLINLPFKWFEFPFWSILVLRQLSIVQKSKKNCKNTKIFHGPTI